ncbi:MAG: DUF86 domain-containing protein [Anaerolineales bacterium]|nr:DUF86 domain-containing protein [Anaerolineales bacterium]
MAPDVLARKLAYLYRLLDDLEPYHGATLAEVEAEHYKIERLFELLVATATDILFHVLAEKGIAPTSYRDAFAEAGKAGLLSQELAQRLGQAAGMRNILVHLYEQIDYEILHQSIRPALRDFAQFAAIFTPKVDE